MKNKRLFVFLEFLIGGVILGVIEDFLLIKLASNELFTLNVFWIVLLVTVPFAFFGEYVIDRVDFLKLFGLNKKYKRLEVFFEFLIFGIMLGVVEDLTAFYLVVGGPITFQVVWIAILIVIPFAFVGEYLLDRVSFQKTLSHKKLTWKNHSH